MNIKIGDKEIGHDKPVFIVAELSCNHRHDYKIAVKTIKAIKETGADAVKFSTDKPDKITIDCDNKYFQIKQGTIWDGTTLFKLYKETDTPWEWQPKLKKIAENLGLVCFSTPSDNSGVDFLDSIKVPAYKIASFEITDINLIEYIAKKGKPIIISTGIAKKNEIKDAINICRKVGNNKIILLKCTSSYPALPEEMNLNMIPEMRERFKVNVGLSDHSLSPIVPISAVSLGADVIEKHFILDRNLGGPDGPFSMEPKEFKKMVEDIRETEKALGKITYSLSARSKKNRQFSRSIFAINNIRKGEIFTEENIRSIRPGFGLLPKYLNDILGKKAIVDIDRGTPLSFGDIDKTKRI